MPLHVYNPRETSPEVLEAMFVGRDDELRQLLDDLERQREGGERRHWLVLGPRGIGKSHLLGILYYRVRKKPDLHRTYLPIWLAENEAYSVYSTGLLLLLVAEVLVKELRGEEPIEASRLDERLAALEGAGDDPLLLEQVAELLRAVAARLGKILLILVENLDAAIDGLPGQRGTEEIERFESLLAAHPELLFISTTAGRLVSDHAAGRPSLAGRFEPLRLPALSEDELGELFPRLARITGQAAKAHLAGPDSQGSKRRRVLHRLTGGNPRAVVMAFSVVTGSPTVQAMVDELHALLDAQTAYFEARLARLAPRARTIVTKMALARENLTLAEIARRTRLPERSLATQLARLVEEGHVAAVSAEGSRGAIYELRDGLFRLWFQFRRGRKVLRPLVRFLALWHPVEDLERALGDLRSIDLSPFGDAEPDLQRAAEWQLQRALELAREQALGERASMPGTEPTLATVLRFRPGQASAQEPGVAQQLLEARLGRLRELVGREDARPAATLRRASARRELGLTLLALERHDEAVAELRTLIESSLEQTDPALEELAVRTTFDLITAFAQLGRFEEALALCEDFLDRAAGSRLPELQEPLARTMFHLAATLGQLGSIQVSLRAHESLLRRFGGARQPRIDVLVARSTFALGQGLWQLGRYEEAIEVCARLERDFAESRSLAIREQVAAAGLLLGLVHQKLGRLSEATGIYRGLLERLRACGEQGLRVVAASATAALGLAELEAGEIEAAVERFLVWTTAVAAEPELDEGPLGPSLKLFLESFPPEVVRGLLERLAAIEDLELAETARLYRLVLDVVEAVETSHEGEIGERRPSKMRFALARVPPELRKTVEELAESILATRRGNLSRDAPPAISPP